MTLDHVFRDIHVVGMTKERAWEIALNAPADPKPTPRKARTIELSREIAKLLHAGMVRREIMERLGVNIKQYDHARQVAKQAGLL